VALLPGFYNPAWVADKGTGMGYLQYTCKWNGTGAVPTGPVKDRDVFSAAMLAHISEHIGDLSLDWDTVQLWLAVLFTSCSLAGILVQLPKLDHR
jgi:hypothetical protein